jgi:hypothetical protein
MASEFQSMVQQSPMLLGPWQGRDIVEQVRDKEEEEEGDRAKLHLSKTYPCNPVPQTKPRLLSPSNTLFNFECINGLNHWLFQSPHDLIITGSIFIDILSYALLISLVSLNPIKLISKITFILTVIVSKVIKS